MSKFPVMGQIIRYGVVGVLNNLLGYCIYLVITYFWLDPKVAISLLYPIGATTAYFGHSKYSFSYSGTKKRALWRYIVAHFISYGANYLMLYVLWERLGFPHQAVQAAAIFICAGILFVLMRYFVFYHSDLNDIPSAGHNK